MSWRIKDAKDIAKITDPKLRAIIEEQAKDIIPPAPPVEVKMRRGKKGPEHVYILDPEKELVLREKLRQAQDALNLGNEEGAKLLVNEALEDLVDLGPYDALVGFFSFLMRVKRAFKAAIYGWPK